MVTKWGFGAAPFKDITLVKNNKALIVIKDYLLGKTVDNCLMLECCSHTKGMFNRVVKQDQWDWFTTYMYFDYPNIEETKSIVSLLQQLRVAITQDNVVGTSKIKERIRKTNLMVYIDNYLDYNPEVESGDQFVYILSRKEEKELLKIGMTTRNVIKRCNEINSATGVVYPFSPRTVFRVIDAKKAEREVHAALAQWRVRNDREFFVMDYAIASFLIEKLLRKNNLLLDKYRVQQEEDT